MQIFNQIGRFFNVYKKYIGYRLIIVFVLAAFAACAEGIGIAMLLPLIDVAGVGIGGEAVEPSKVKLLLVTILDSLGVSQSMIGILLFIAILFLVKGLIIFSSLAYQSHLKSSLMYEIRSLMFKKYSTMSYEYYSKKNTGHFVNIILSQINTLIGSFDPYKNFLTTIIMNVAYFSMAFIMAPYFAIMAVGAGGVLLFSFRGLNRFVQRLSFQTVDERSNLNKLLVQTVQSFKYLLSTSQFDYLQKEVMQSIKRLAGFMRSQGIAQAFSVSLSEPLSIFFILVVIIVQVVVLDAALPPIFVALILLNRAMGGIFYMQQAWQSTLKCMGSLDIVEQEFRIIEGFQEISGGSKVELHESGIELHSVSYSYNRSKEYVLKNISLTIPTNATVAFVGESGAGKSTLVDMLTLMHRPNSGEILIGGTSSKEVDLAHWRKQIGYVSQETIIFDDTVANNICLWKDNYSVDPKACKDIENAAEKAYAMEFIQDMPDQFNTLVGDRGILLSGGQRQRLFLARELYKKPALLILDEATSALDSKSEKYIKKSIEDLKGKTTVIIIAHRLSTIKHADLIFVLNKGEIVERGTYDELISKKDGQFSSMVSLQSL